MFGHSGIHPLRCTWQHSQLRHQTAVPNIDMNHRSHLSWTEQGAPGIVSSPLMGNLLHHFSRHSIALNLIFTTNRLSPTFPNFLSSLQQMEPTPSKARNPCSPKNLEEHLERSLALKKTAIYHSRSNICLPITWLCPLYCGWLMSGISSVKQDDNTNQEMGHNQSEDIRESTF